MFRQDLPWPVTTRPDNRRFTDSTQSREIRRVAPAALRTHVGPRGPTTDAHASLSADQPLRFKTPLLFDAVPDIGCPQDISARRVKLNCQFWFVRRHIVVYPAPDRFVAR